jgi:hypothetical protein
VSEGSYRGCFCQRDAGWEWWIEYRPSTAHENDWRTATVMRDDGLGSAPMEPRWEPFLWAARWCAGRWIRKRCRPSSPIIYGPEVPCA